MDYMPQATEYAPPADLDSLIREAAKVQQECSRRLFVLIGLDNVTDDQLFELEYLTARVADQAIAMAVLRDQFSNIGAGAAGAALEAA